VGPPGKSSNRFHPRPDRAGRAGKSDTIEGSFAVPIPMQRLAVPV